MRRTVHALPVLVNGRAFLRYVNYCIYAGTPLDWWPNEFFNDDRRFLTCVGGALFPLRVQVTGDRIVVTASFDP
jgi:hypothetical protein